MCAKNCLGALFLTSIFLFSCESNKSEKSNEQVSKIASNRIPSIDSTKTSKPAANIEKTNQIGECEGDLDNDGINEKVIVLNTEDTSDFGVERVIKIFKKENQNWRLWHESKGAVLPSSHGGMMEDPFQEIKVERNCIVIDHFGGSRDKWSYVHRYRYQNNDWYLIGATINYGVPCEYWENYDYNLITEKVTSKYDTEVCEEEQEENEEDPKKEKHEEFTLIHKLNAIPKMDGFYPGDNKVELSKANKEFNY